MQQQLVGQLGEVWDLDFYVLLLHCLTGVVAVRPADVGLEVTKGRAVSETRFDPSGLHKLFGASRVITRRALPEAAALHIKALQLQVSEAHDVIRALVDVCLQEREAKEAALSEAQAARQLAEKLRSS